MKCVISPMLDDIHTWANDLAAHINRCCFATDAPLIPVKRPKKDSVQWMDFSRLALATDWACYALPEDRADFARMNAVMTAFPDGFDFYMATSLEGETVPVGYTGWYSISEEVFAQAHDNPSSVTSRAFMKPLPGLGPYIYLFSYCVIPELRGTAQSGELVKRLAAKMEQTPKKGMLAVTVSEAGARVSQKFGLTYRGDMTHDGVAEGVYAAYL
jgi:hypothetical protein